MNFELFLYFCNMKVFHQLVRDLLPAYPESEARALARWVCEELCGLSQTDILLDKDNHLSAEVLAKVEEITSRLLRHEPIQYILGAVEFCNHRFLVGPGVLIPRPETAELVRSVIDSCMNGHQRDIHRSGHNPSFSILDIGTGSGCIALSLALALPFAAVTGWDVSNEALAVARSNARLYPEVNVTFGQTDILSTTETPCQWDIIVSNPPYVRQSEAAAMSENVLKHEPHQALFVPDDDPLLFYRAIARFAQTGLKTDGQLWFEINEALGKETAELIEEMGFTEVDVYKDLYGKDRILKARNQRKD